MMSSPNLIRALPPTIQCSPIYNLETDAHGYQLNHPDLGTLGDIWIATSGVKRPNIQARLATSTSTTVTEKRRALFNPLSRKIRAYFAAPQNPLQALTPEHVPYCPAELTILGLRCHECNTLLGRFAIMPGANTPALLENKRSAYYALMAAWSLPTWIIGGNAVTDEDTVLVSMPHTEQALHFASLGQLNKMIRAKQRKHCATPHCHTVS